MKHIVILSSIFFFLPHPQDSSPLSVSQRQGSSNRVNIPRTCWTKLFGPRIYLDRSLTNTPQLYSRSKSSPNWKPAIFAECSQLCSRTNVHPVKNGLKIWRWVPAYFSPLLISLFIFIACCLRLLAVFHWHHLVQYNKSKNANVTYTTGLFS